MFKCVCGRDASHGMMETPWVCECGLSYGIGVDMAALMRRIDRQEERLEEVERRTRRKDGSEG